MLQLLDLLAYCKDNVYIMTLLENMALFLAALHAADARCLGVRFVFSLTYWLEIVLLLALVHLHQ